MLQDVLLSAARLPLLFRGDVMRSSSNGVLLVVTPPLLVFLAFKVRSGMRVSHAAVWAFLGVYASWAAGLLFEPNLHAVSIGAIDSSRHWISLVPFATIGSQVGAASGTAIVQLVGNIGLLLPLGLFGPVVMPSLRRAPRLALVALAASVAIELVQFAGTQHADHRPVGRHRRRDPQCRGRAPGLAAVARDRLGSGAHDATECSGRVALMTHVGDGAWREAAGSRLSWTRLGASRG